MNIEKFEKDMMVFSFRQHQDVLTYLSHLEASGWTIEDAENWIEGEKKRLTLGEKNIPSPVFLCPLCSSPMQLLQVNVDNATKTDDDSKSVWLCSNKECLDTIYNNETIQDIMKELTKK